MTMDTYLWGLKRRYLQGNRKTKAEVLNELCRTGGYHRKHAIRILNHKILGEWREKPLGRKKQYKPQELIPHLKEIWLATDQLCGKRLKVAIPLWLPFYEKKFGALESAIRNNLLKASAATLDRLIHPLRCKHPKRLGGTKPGSLLKKDIPIKTDQWNEERPGFFEGDLVAHCGTSLLGSFIWSLTLTDICSSWTENAAVWNKGAQGVVEQIGNIEKRLPFPILGFDSDNGSEFLNYHLVRYFHDRVKPVQFTRSRPYRKDDNAHVEQKNWTHVRQLFGYYRLDNQQLVALMNDIYQNECSFLHNYFYPSMKLKDKIRVQSKIKKKHDLPQTPYQRLLASQYINDLQKAKLKKIYESLDPFELKQNLERKLKRIFQYVRLHLKKKTG